MSQRILKSVLMTMVCFAFTAAPLLAQTGTIQGTVTNASNGETLPGVNIYITELERGSATDSDGTYQIEDVEYGTYTLRASYVGFTTHTQTITVDQPNNVVNIELVSDTQQLGDVVVTAFGLSREQKSLGYSVQEVEGSQVNMTDNSNIVGALAGKVAGVQVIGTSGANLGGSEKIRLRGANGLSDGQPLFVVDGTPISNESFSPRTRGRDFGNLAQDLNLQDVESISVLKGAAASALYGNRASDGVILITTKTGAKDQPVQIDYSNSTSFDRVYILPEYQNEYAGGYTQELIDWVDPETGQTVQGLNYAADESWGPRMEGQMYRPWWSWFHHDFTGDGQDDYGTEIPLEAHPNNVRNFFDTGIKLSNSLAISGGTDVATYRASIKNTGQTGVIPNSSLDRTYINFNGSLQHGDKLTSEISFNYVNTQGEGRPAQGYAPAQGNPVNSFNQWFQRQLDMDYLRQYKKDDGTFMSWNIRSPSNLRPLYWNSPYFTPLENVPLDDRDRVYGNYSLSYNVNQNLSVTGKIHADLYDFVREDRIASGGLEQDWFSTSQRSRRELNYELGLNYSRDFTEDFSFSGFLGANIRHEEMSRVNQSTRGGLSTPNLFNIEASVDRPNVSNYKFTKEVRSIYGTTSLGWKDMVYVEATLRNDWSSTLPEENNSYLYYGFSGSFVFTELPAFSNQNLLSFGKLRASIAQVGEDVNPYRVFQTYNVSTPYGNNPTLSVPNTRSNSELKAAISTDYEAGIDLRFLNGRLRTDLAYYNSVREDEILALEVPAASGYEQVIVNAGEFETNGWEAVLGATAVQSSDLNVDFTVNWAASTSKVNRLAEGLTSRELEDAYFGVDLFAREGEEWGLAVTEGGYGGFQTDANGNKIVTTSGLYALERNKELGTILPDWTGGFRADVQYKNFTLGAFIDFQKGGQFYSLTKMFNAYSGLGTETVGNNALGNPLRDPVADQSGNSGLTTVRRENAAANSGGVLVSGVDENGNQVAYLTEAQYYFGNMFFNKEAWLFDASYVKLREVKLTYNIPAKTLESLPFKRASVAVDMQNPLLIYASTSGVDPSAIQNGTSGFSFWEGAGLPGVRSIGFNVNLSF